MIQKIYKNSSSEKFINCFSIRRKFNDKIYEFKTFDIDGQIQLSINGESLYRIPKIILIFYDSLDKDYFEKAKRIYQQTFEINKKIIYFLVRS